MRFQKSETLLEGIKDLILTWKYDYGFTKEELIKAINTVFKE